MCLRVYLALLACAVALLEACEPYTPFPAALVDFVPYEKNPVFVAEGPGHWDQAFQERGWILHDKDGYHLWYAAYDFEGAQQRKLGYAISPDGLTWVRDPGNNPIYDDHWIEDVNVIVMPNANGYSMFAEGGEGVDDEAQWLTSPDRVTWTRQGALDIRYQDGTPLSPGPYGTPTVLRKNGTWYLLYERTDDGIWLASSPDFRVWTNVQDEPVLPLGPGEYDSVRVSLNQVMEWQGRYFAYYNGQGRGPIWTVDTAVSDDLIHWQKYSANPVMSGEAIGVVVDDGQRFRLYTQPAVEISTEMHLYLSRVSHGPDPPRPARP